MAATCFGDVPGRFGTRELAPGWILSSLWSLTTGVGGVRLAPLDVEGGGVAIAEGGVVAAAVGVAGGEGGGVPAGVGVRVGVGEGGGVGAVRF